MSLLSSFFGSAKKTNLTPDVPFKMPAQINPEMYGSLSKLSKQRIQAGTTGEETPGVGFGPDFVNKSTNAQAKSMRQMFLDYTDPYLNAELSKRGVSRSIGPGLATDVKTRAYNQNQSDIEQLVERFYTLNEAQKKSDITEGIGVGSNILTNDINQANNQASASERLANLTNADARTREKINNDKMGQMFQAAAMLAVPAIGGLGGTLSGIGNAGLNAGYAANAGRVGTGMGLRLGTGTGVGSTMASGFGNTLNAGGLSGLLNQIGGGMQSFASNPAMSNVLGGRSNDIAGLASAILDEKKKRGLL